MAQARHRHGWVTELRAGDRDAYAPADGTPLTARLMEASRGLLAAQGPSARAQSSRLSPDHQTEPTDLPLLATLPVALGHRDRGAMLARRTSARRHGVTTDVCCVIYALWIAELVEGAPMPNAWRHALALAQAYTLGNARRLRAAPEPRLPAEFWRQLEMVASLPYEQLQPAGLARSTSELLIAAAWCCLNARDVEETLVLAVNLAGLASGISAVAGGAAGTCYGEERVPRRWVERLRVRDELHALAEALTRVRAL